MSGAGMSALVDHLARLHAEGRAGAPPQLWTDPRADALRHFTPAAVLVAAFFDDIRLTQDVAVDLLLVFVSFWVALCWRQLLDDMSRGAVPDPDQETGPRAEQVAAAAARGPK